MSALELKGRFIKLLAEVEDAKMLEQMLSYCLALASGKHALADFSPELISELEDAIADSDNEEDLLDNQEAFKMFRQWSKE